jgi:hypothetical protein
MLVGFIIDKSRIVLIFFFLKNQYREITETHVAEELFALLPNIQTEVRHET